MKSSDIYDVFQQLPASLFYKKKGDAQFIANRALKDRLGLNDQDSVNLNSLKFHHPITNTELSGDQSLFHIVDAGGSICQQVLIALNTHWFNCFVKSSEIHQANETYSVIYVAVNSNDILLSSEQDPHAEKHIKFNQLLTNLSSKLINAGDEELDAIIDQSLSAFGQFCGVHRCYLFSFSDDLTTMSNTHEWVAEGITPYIDELQALPTSEMPYLMSHLMKGSFIIDDVNNIPDHAHNEREEFEREQIGAVLCVRITVDGDMYGFVGCDIIGRPYKWTDYDVDYLKAIGEMLGNKLHSLFNRKALQEMQAELVEANQQLAKLANIDGLTGIGNRRLFDATLERDIKRSKVQQSPLSLIIIDIDYFKSYNDIYGHVAGDAVIREVASCLVESCMGNEDLVTRYGGEEFAIILPDTDEDEAMMVAQRIISNIHLKGIENKGATKIGCLTVSAGVACLESALYEPKTLIEQADQALYRAKSSGKNCARL